MSRMLRLRAEKAGMNVDGSKYIGCSDDIQALKEVVCAQQILLQKLNAELDSEREASATAASEALAMILRLQGEKAAVIMEEIQYKRMAEEKIFHAEECLALFEDVTYQKEMEIASLEYQIQAYRCKLFGLGYSDLGFYENEIPESLLFPRNNSINGDLAGNGNVRRMSSLPPIEVEESYHKGTRERKKYVNSALDSTKETVEESKLTEYPITELEKNKKIGNGGAGDFDLCCEHVKKLNGQVKEISKFEDFGKDTSTGPKCAYEFSSLVSQASTPSSFNRIGNEVSLKNQIQYSKPLSETAGNPSRSSTMLDIFEVPKQDNSGKTRSHWMKEHNGLLLEGENRPGKPDVVSDDTSELRFREEMELSQGMREDELSADETRAQLRQLSQRIQLLEEERGTQREEINAEDTEEQQLLKEISEKLNYIQAEIESSKPREASPRNDSALVSLMEEAMLCFWL